jgi:hypothetical protein
MGRFFMKPVPPGGDEGHPTSLWDVIDPVTYEPREGWIELTRQVDNGKTLNPTIEAGIVNALQEECGRTAAEHGFSQDWEDAAFLEKVAEKMSGYQVWEITGDVDQKDASSVEDRLLRIAASYRNNILGTKLMLIVSELSEGLESLRNNGGAAGALDGQGNLPEELADAIVRILDTGTCVQANLGDELLNKMETNKGRPRMHGNKVM